MQKSHFINLITGVFVHIQYLQCLFIYCLYFGFLFFNQFNKTLKVRIQIWNGQTIFIVLNFLQVRVLLLLNYLRSFLNLILLIFFFLKRFHVSDLFFNRYIPRSIQFYFIFNQNFLFRWFFS
jgi:hypothetical protein